MSSVKTNIAYNFAYQVLILALPLVTAPYLSRVIGANGIGTYSYSYAIATYFVYVVMLGLNNYGNRTIAACGSREERTRVFWSIYTMQVICFVISGFTYALYALLWAENQLVALLQGLYVVSSLFDINWFFFGVEQFKLTVIRNTIVKVFTVVLVFLFVKSASDVTLYVGIMGAGTLLSQAVLWPFLRKFVGIYRPKPKEVLSHVKPNVILFVSVIAISVYNTLSRIMLGAMAGTEAVGYFENAEKIVSVPSSLVSAVGTVMLPRTSALMARGKYDEASAHIDRTMAYIMAFAGVATFGIPCVADSFVMVFYGPGFEKTAEILVVLCATVPLLAFGNVMRTQYLIPKGRDSVFLLSAVCGAVASVTVNYATIPQFGAMGAAYASVAAQAVVLVCQVVCVRRDFPVRRYVLLSTLFLLMGAIMSFVLQFVPRPENSLIDTFATVAVGLAIYVPLMVVGLLLFLRKGKRAKG